MSRIRTIKPIETAYTGSRRRSVARRRWDVSHRLLLEGATRSVKSARLEAEEKRRSR